MSSRWIRLMARLGALIFLGLAVVRFWTDYFASVHAEEEATASGFTIDRTVMMSHGTIAFALVGLIFLVLSLAFPSRNRIEK